MTEFEKNCYGMSEADIREQYVHSITARFSGIEMVVMSVLSDCQEMLSFIDTHHDADERTKEQVRKQLNVAKFILSDMLQEKEPV
jgi:hypothetical protein